MGSLCCQTDVQDTTPFSQIMPHFKDYQKVDWPQNDQVIEEWKSKLNENQKQNNAVEGEKQQVSYELMKHKEEDRYYFGSWDKDGYPTGKGQIYQPHRFFFKGNFQKGIPNGESVIRFMQKNSEFQGNLENGQASGPGRFYDYNSKYTFDGQWENSKPKSGKLTFNNDKNITNIIYSDFKTGEGIINYKDQRQYKGFINTKKILPDGEGTVYFSYLSSKLQYQGQWKMGQMHGKGKMQWKDGSVYEGQYVHGKKEGYGKFIFASKACYQGTWRNGKQQGAGVLFNLHGQQQKRGLWENGKFVKQLNPEQFEAQRKKDIEGLSSSIKSEVKDLKEHAEHQYQTGRPPTIKQEENEQSYNKSSSIRQQIKEQVENGSRI